MPFEPGNKHGGKRKRFEQTIDRIVAQDDGKRLRAVAERIWTLAEEGERWACEMLRDTLDGRPATAIVATDAEGRALTIGLVAFGPGPGPDTPSQLHAKGLPAPVIEGTVRRH